MSLLLGHSTSSHGCIYGSFYVVGQWMLLQNSKCKLSQWSLPYLLKDILLFYFFCTSVHVKLSSKFKHKISEVICGWRLDILIWISCKNDWVYPHMAEVYTKIIERQIYDIWSYVWLAFRHFSLNFMQKWLSLPSYGWSSYKNNWTLGIRYLKLHVVDV